MKHAIGRAIMAVATRCLGERRREWSAAMRAEFEAAACDGRATRFAIGCLGAAVREMLLQDEGRLALTSYGLVLGVMLPMAALQIGCAVLGLPYLYPGSGGLSAALLAVGPHEGHLRGVYQAAVPSLALLQLLLGLGHMRIAWALLERDWARVVLLGTRTLAAGVTLLLFMAVLFLDSTQAVIQVTILGIELTALCLVARWHAGLPEPEQRRPRAA